MPNDRNAGRKPKVTDEQLEEIKLRREAGESVASLAKEYGVSRQALNKRLINYALSLSKPEYGFKDNPEWVDLKKLLEEEYLRAKGVSSLSQLLCIDKYENINIDDLGDLKEKIVVRNGQWMPRVEFSKSDRIVTRTDTDGYQMKALTRDRLHFVKSQAVISGVKMRDWAVELIACDICNQLDIPCVQQHHCEFVYEGREFDGVYSDNFELDGYTFISFERLLERLGKSSKEEEFISLNALEKMKWCAQQLAEVGALPYEDTLKYMLDLAVVDCLVGNIDRHTRNFGLFYNVNAAKYEIPLIFDNGMGLFENDYYRDNYKSFEEAMNSVYVAPYGEDPFEMLQMLDEEFDLKKVYSGLVQLHYADKLYTPFALEYERRMTDIWQK